MGTDGKIYAGVRNVTTFTAASTNTLIDNNWHYVVASFLDTGNWLRIYVDERGVVPAVVERRPDGGRGGTEGEGRHEEPGHPPDMYPLRRSDAQADELRIEANWLHRRRSEDTSPGRCFEEARNFPQKILQKEKDVPAAQESNDLTLGTQAEENRRSVPLNSVYRPQDIALGNQTVGLRAVISPDQVEPLHLSRHPMESELIGS